MLFWCIIGNRKEETQENVQMKNVKNKILSHLNIIYFANSIATIKDLQSIQCIFVQETIEIYLLESHALFY